MRATVLFSLATALLLGACASEPGREAPGENDKIGAVVAPAAEPELDISKAASMPPDEELSGPLLYDLLVAEMLAQHGEMDMAALQYQRVAMLSRDARLAQRATQLAVYARDFELALKAAELWVRLDPHGMEANQSLAALLVGHQRTAEAEAPLHMLLATQPPEQGYEQVVQVLARAEEPELVLAIITRLGDAFPGPYARLSHARLAAHLGELEQADEALQALVADVPDGDIKLQALLLLARVQFDREQPEAALASMARAVESAPDNADARSRYGRMLLDRNQLSEAREQFKELLRIQGDEPDADVLKAMGLLAAEAEEWDEAERYLSRLADIEGYADEAYFSLGTMEERRGNWQAAIAWYEQASGERSRIKAQLRIVQLLREHRGGEAALAHLRATSPRNQDEEVLLTMGEVEVLEAMERKDEAMERLNLALESLPHNIELLYTRAMLGERMGYLNVLERDLRAILAIEPENAEALNALGYTLADRTERYQEALELIEKALKLKPEDAAVLDSMGWVLHRLGRSEEALEYLRKAAERMEDGEVAAHLGEVLWHLGERDEARRVWEEARGYPSGQAILEKTIERFQP